MAKSCGKSFYHKGWKVEKNFGKKLAVMITIPTFAADFCLLTLTKERKNIMKKFLVMAALMVATLSVSAQDYEWAVGLRGGGFSGLTAKKNTGSNAIEAGLSLYNGGFAIDAVYEWQEPVIGEGFHLYYGAGAYTQVAGKFFGLGAEAVLGLEYRLPINFPLAISLDYRPGINVLGDAGVQFWGGNFGFGVKYCF